MSYNSVDEEENAVRAFVASHPFPSYETMADGLLKLDDWFPKIEWWSEFGEYNHAALKTCYDNITDKSVCHKMGTLIYKRGGITALRANFYTFNHLSPLARSKDRSVFYYTKVLEIYWDGIGEWRA